jgi:hypothetical protein
MWESVEIIGRGWYVRRKIEGATAQPYETIGFMGDMCVPHLQLTQEAAKGIIEALNSLTTPARHK